MVARSVRQPELGVLIDTAFAGCFWGAPHGIRRIKIRHLPDVFLPSERDFLALPSQVSDSHETSYKAYVQSVLVKQRVAGFRPPAKKTTGQLTTGFVNRTQSYSGRPGGAGRLPVEKINSGEKRGRASGSGVRDPIPLPDSLC